MGVDQRVWDLAEFWIDDEFGHLKMSPDLRKTVIGQLAEEIQKTIETFIECEKA